MEKMLKGRAWQPGYDVMRKTRKATNYTKTIVETAKSFPKGFSFGVLEKAENPENEIPNNMRPRRTACTYNKWRKIVRGLYTMLLQ